MTTKNTLDDIRGQLSESMVFFGAGGLGRAFLAFAQSCGFSPSFFVDSSADKWGTSLDGIPIHSVETLIGTNANVVLTNSFHWETRSLLQGKTNGLILHPKLAALALYPDRHDYVDTLADTDSIEILDSLLSYFAGDISAPKRSQYPHYKHPALSPDRVSSIVDAGAYNGVQLKLLKDYFGPETTIHAFEPVPGNHQQLREATAELSNCHIHQAGLWSKTTKLSFDVNSAASRVIENSEDTEKLPVVALDEMKLDVDLIKMDIEGAEPQALAGAKETIQRCQPNMAISIYHNFSDFIQLPTEIRKMLPEHHFFLGQHNNYPADEAFYEYETVFYAIRPSDIRRNKA